MKKLFAVIFTFLVFAFVMGTSVLAADKTAVLKTSSENSPTPIDYDLPYPGILPDSPIYFLKVARDKVVGFLIPSSVNKSFYSLLLSDKRLAAGQILMDTGKASLGAKTVTNGEEYFVSAVDAATKAKADGLEETELLAKLSVSTVKHQEVISELLIKATDEEKTMLNKAYSDSQNSQNRVQVLMKK